MKTITLLCTTVLITTVAFAQNGITPTNVKTSIMRKQGKVWIVKPMQTEETMANGLIVQPNGAVKNSTSKTMFLSNGDCVSTNGDIIGLNEKNINSAVIKNGRMWIITKLDEPLQLSDGTTILPNGSIMENNGKTVLLKNNELVNISSSRYSTWQPKNVMALNN